MVTLPKEPTVSMKQAACSVYIKDPDLGIIDLCWEDIENIYKAMIDAYLKEKPCN